MKLPKVLSFLALIVLPLFIFVGIANAQTFRSGNTVTVGQGETVDGMLWASGKTIDIAGTVKGDIFCAGQNVSISGTVEGDLICAAQTINVTGTVSGDIRAAAQTINIGANVASNLTAAAQTVTLESKGKIGRDASLAVQDVTIHGTVSRDLALASQNAYVSGNIGRNIKADLNNLNIADSAVVGGQIEYTSSNEASIAQGARITGDSVRIEPAPTEDDGNFGFMLAASLALLATALALVALFPRTFQRLSDYAIDSPLKTLATGFIASIIVPALIFVVMLTLVGIPFALIAIVAWLLITGLSGGFAAYTLGRAVWREQTNALLLILAGGAILLVLRFIPIIGLITTAFAMWFGMGMILLELWQRFQKPQYNIKKL